MRYITLLRSHIWGRNVPLGVPLLSILFIGYC